MSCWRALTWLLPSCREQPKPSTWSWRGDRLQNTRPWRLPGSTHLDFQLLDHLHLNSTLGRAPVIERVFCVEVSAEENREG